MEMDKLIESINAGDADVYFIGFKSELGDSVISLMLWFWSRFF